MHARFSVFTVSIHIKTVLSRSMCPCSLVGVLDGQLTCKLKHSEYMAAYRYFAQACQGTSDAPLSSTCSHIIFSDAMVLSSHHCIQRPTFIRVQG